MDKARILVAEDDAFLREVYLETLTRGGYTVETAADGEEALIKLKQPGWSLVLLDIVMPKMDGLSVLKTAKRDPAFDATHKMPVIFLTNLDNDAEIQEALQIGDGYLIKSQLTPADLIQEVRNHLTKQQAVV